MHRARENERSGKQFIKNEIKKMRAGSKFDMRSTNTANRSNNVLSVINQNDEEENTESIDSES